MDSNFRLSEDNLCPASDFSICWPEPPVPVSCSSPAASSTRTHLDNTGASVQVVVDLPQLQQGDSAEVELSAEQTEEIGVSKVTITVTRSASNVTVKITKTAGSSNSSPPSDDTYSYLDISADDLPSDGFDEVVIAFEVPTSWLAEKGVDPDDIGLFRLVEGDWVALPTESLDSTDDFVFYEAVSPGLSEFAVAASSSTVGPTFTRITWPSSQEDLGEPFEIAVEATNKGNTAALGGISVSFLNLDDPSGLNSVYSTPDGTVEVMRHSGGGTPQFYARDGGRQLTRDNGSKIDPNYLLVEIEWDTWSEDADRFLRLKVTPKREGNFTINVRTWVCESNYRNCSYDPDPRDPSGVSGDQQGWKVDQQTIQIVGVPKNPDLVVSNIDAPSAGTVGESIAVSFTVENRGEVDSSTMTNSLFLSDDPNVTASDTFLANSNMSAISPGERRTNSLSLTLPVGLGSGRYYIGVAADSSGTNDESDESNNSKATAIEVSEAEGSIEVIIDQGPEEAKWKVNGEGNYTSGQIIAVPAGVTTVSLSAEQGWSQPADLTTTVRPGETVRHHVSYRIRLFETPSQPRESLQQRFEDLARHWAPVILQDTDPDVDPFGGRSDFITAWDFDDLNPRNNWENLEKVPGVFNLGGKVYYWVLESERHWYIGYGIFHPRDWGGEAFVACKDDGNALRVCHENDMEGLLLTIRKSADPYGSFLVMTTVAHAEFLTFKDYDASPSQNVDGLPIQCNLIDCDVEFFQGSTHPFIYVEDKSHIIDGAERWEDEGLLGEERFPGGDGVTYYPTGFAEVPIDGNDRFVGYELVDIGELWDYALDSSVFELSHDTGVGGPFLGDNGFPDNQASPPWRWGSKDWSGVLFLDPARWVNEKHNDLVPWSADIEYLRSYVYTPPSRVTTYELVVNGSTVTESHVDIPGGTVVVDPEPNTGESEYVAGTTVTLVVIPDEGYEGSCELSVATMTSDRFVQCSTSEVDAETYVLRINGVQVPGRLSASTTALSH